MRYKFIDFIRGTAFILMIIHHIYYFNPNIRRVPNHIQTIGSIARNLFIFLVGFGIGLSKDKKVFTKRNLDLFICSLLVTVVSYIFLPFNNFIFFGVLHFILFANLILRPISESNTCILLIGIIAYLMNIYIKKFNGTNDITGLILGRFTKTRSPLDIFSIFKWLPLVCMGIIFANINYKKVENVYQMGGSNKNINLMKLVELVGENSLYLYIAHVIPCLYWTSFKYN